VLIPGQDSNIVLAHTYEYRQPSVQKRMEASTHTAETRSVKMDMPSRYLGLVVVPGKYITKIEVEEFASQMKQGITTSSHAGIHASLV
jgi:hypothetical protein